MTKTFAALPALLTAFTMAAAAGTAQPKNVIILIGDGMGFNHAEAGSLYRYGRPKGQPYWKMIPLAAQTHSLNNEGGYAPQKAHSDFDYVKQGATDSAAAASALSTGHKTRNGLIGVSEDGRRLTHIMEDAERMGKSTGVVTTVYFAHATPAGFIAHNPSRNNYAEIAREMIWESGADLIMGAGHPWYDGDGNRVGGLEPDPFETPLTYGRVGGLESWRDLQNGIPARDADGDGSPDPWNLVTTREEIRALAQNETPGRVLGVLPAHGTLQANRGGDAMAGPFEVPLNQTSPTMTELMEAALHALSRDPDGFVLMAEGGAIDWASHANQPGRMIEEQIDFDRAAEYAIEWIEKHSGWDETLLIVTADHETGYLTGMGSDPLMLPLTNRGPGAAPGMEWHSGSHTNQLVPLFVKGPGAAAIAGEAVGVDERFGPYVDNTAPARILRAAWGAQLPPEPDFHIQPYLQRAGTEHMTIMFESNIPTRAVVEFGEALMDSGRANLSRKATSNSLETIHEIALENLEPETNYFYRVAIEDGTGTTAESETLSFKTNAKPDSAYSFAVFGDSQTNPDVWGAIARLAWGERPNFAVHAGDIVGDGNIKAQWSDHFFGPGHVFMGRVPVYMILGNHENDAGYYYKYVSNPEPEYYYTFTYGNAQFFLLDSCRGLSPGSEIHGWLDSALSRSDSEWKFVVHHHPPYTSDENDYGDTYNELALPGDPNVQPLIPLYDKYGVDMVFYGHIHDYERTWPLRDNRIDHGQGVIYIQTGGCGGNLEDYAPTRSWFTKKVRRDHHFCMVNVHGGRLMFQAIDVNGNLFDTFTLEK